DRLGTTTLSGRFFLSQPVHALTVRSDSDSILARSRGCCRRALCSMVFPGPCCGSFHWLRYVARREWPAFYSDLAPDLPFRSCCPCFAEPRSVRFKFARRPC